MAKQKFSSNLRAEIARTGINQSRLAEAAGCTQSAISDYKNGERMPTGDILVGLAKALGTTAEYLVSGVSTQSQSQSQSQSQTAVLREGHEPNQAHIARVRRAVRKLREVIQELEESANFSA